MLISRERISMSFLCLRSEDALVRLAVTVGGRGLTFSTMPANSPAIARPTPTFAAVIRARTCSAMRPSSDAGYVPTAANPPTGEVVSARGFRLPGAAGRAAARAGRRAGAQGRVPEARPSPDELVVAA